jgi:prepilin-type processing-associated H-X9-DG protein
MLRNLIAILLLLLSPAAAFAQALADRVPADAIIYAGWRGAADLGPGYSQSHLKAVLDECDFRAFVDDFLPKVIDRVGRENPQAEHISQIVSAIAKPTWQRPTAFFFSGLVLPPGQPPAPHLGMIWKAGPDADSLAIQLEHLVTQAQPPFPVKVVKVADVVALMIGYDNPEAALGSGEKSLAADGAFKSAMSRLKIQPVSALYVNHEKLLDMISTVARQADPEGAAVFGKVVDSLGLRGLKRIAAVSGFDGKDWSTVALIEAPAPRTGLLKVLGSDPLSDQILTAIPRSATNAGATRADFSTLVDTLRSAARNVDPGIADQFDGMLNELAKQSGVHLEQDLLASLGPEWAYFRDPTIGGRGIAGITLVNHLKDPDRFERSMTKFEDFVLRQIEQQLPANDHPHIAFDTLKIDSLTIHYLPLPLVAPCWTVHDGNLYVAAFPQVAAAAARRGSVANSSIAQNPAFTALRTRLGQSSITGFNFQDLPQTAPDAYGSWLVISRIAGLGDIFGIKSPPIILPELGKLQSHLSPAGAVSWTDDAGFHFKSVEPFPGSSALASDPSVAALYAQPAAAMSVLLPALNRAREQANRVKSASNLKQIGLASLMYANAHQGRFAPSFGVLLQQEDLSPMVFFSPRSSHSPPPQPSDARERMAWVNDNSDYVYAGADKTSRSPASAVVAYEKLDDNTEGVNILFADGHVEFLTIEDARRITRPRQGQ